MDQQEPPFAVDVVDVDGSAILRLSGEIDLEASAPIRTAGLRLLEMGHPLVVDMSAVTFFDSSGIGSLVHLVNCATEAGTTLTLRNPSERVQRVLDVAGLAEFLAAAGQREDTDASG